MDCGTYTRPELRYIYASQLQGVQNRRKIGVPIRVPNELFIKVSFWGVFVCTVCVYASQCTVPVFGVYIRVPTTHPPCEFEVFYGFWGCFGVFWGQILGFWVVFWWILWFFGEFWWFFVLLGGFGVEFFFSIDVMTMDHFAAEYFCF